MGISKLINRKFPNQISHIDALAHSINYAFKSDKLFFEALVHSSAILLLDRNDIEAQCYERLEFLGDSVLSVVLSAQLLLHPQRFDEGDLSKIRACLVCEEILAKNAKRIDLGPCVIISPAEEKNGLRTKNSLLADAFEALLGAIYLDGGFEAAQKVILDIYEPYLNGPLDKFLKQNHKSCLQELIQKTHKKTPTYNVLKKVGPDHKPQFEVEVLFQGTVLGRGNGPCKKKASQNAAMVALANLKKNPDLLITSY